MIRDFKYICTYLALLLYNTPKSWEGGISDHFGHILLVRSKFTFISHAPKKGITHDHVLLGVILELCQSYHNREFGKLYICFHFEMRRV